jgi:hypothetical protein
VQQLKQDIITMINCSHNQIVQYAHWCISVDDLNKILNTIVINETIKQCYEILKDYNRPFHGDFGELRNLLGNFITWRVIN